MTGALLLSLVVLGSYLLGAIPFGWIVARARGVDILRVGSGNIGATNVARTVGLGYGVLVFLLDFAKGAVPVVLVRWLDLPAEVGMPPHGLAVIAGVAAFLGHLFPVYLGFRGGKGVATGAGVAVALVPVITLIALACWGLTLAITRYVSIASLLGAALVFLLQVVWTPAPWGNDEIVITLFCLFGAALVFLRHASNIRRLFDGTEPRLGVPGPEVDP
jgi:acyl phosphate:glycerol-3-phosphate acyltransferase